MLPVLEISPLTDRGGLKLAGELDLESAPRFTVALSDFERAGEVSIDMADVTFIDSSGLASILSFARSRNGNGPLVILDPSEIVRRCFEIIRVDQYPGIVIRRSRSPRHI